MDTYIYIYIYIHTYICMCVRVCVVICVYVCVCVFSIYSQLPSIYGGHSSVRSLSIRHAVVTGTDLSWIHTYIYIYTHIYVCVSVCVL